MIVCNALRNTNQSFPVYSVAPTVTDYLYPSAKAPLSPEEPKTGGGKCFCALIHLFNKFLIICYVHGHLLCPWNMKVQVVVLVLQLNSLEEQ